MTAGRTFRKAEVAADRPRETARARPPTETALLHLQATAGNAAVVSLLAGGTPVVQRQTKSKYQLEQLVKGFPARTNEALAAYMTRFNRNHQQAGLDEEDKEIVKTFAASWWDDKIRVEQVQQRTQTKYELAAATARGTAFVSLNADAANNLYTVTRTASTKIQKLSGDQGFDTYSNGSTAAAESAVAINGLDVTGSTTALYARHDFQPAAAGVVNLQVQLGGSAGDFRRRKGDTSWTLVVVSEQVWDAMVAADSARWKAVIQAAQRESLANRTRVQIGAPPG
jgi:hypothetical protein